MSHNLKSIYAICIKNSLIPKDTTYKQFFTTLNNFHIEISKDIMKGYVHSPHGKLGEFNVIKDIRRGKTIDWGKSNKLKQLIIDSGGTPYNKETAPDGEKWHVHYDDKDYFKWHWYKTKATDFTKNLKYYIFRACTYNRKTVGKVIKENKLITTNYVQYSQNSIK